MPQLVLADWPPQLVWLVLTFGVLYLLMALLALPRIAEVLESRENRLTTDLEMAEKLQGEAQTALDEFERVQAETQSQAQLIAAETRAKLATSQAERLAELKAELAEQHRKSEAEIAKATEAAMAGLAEIAIELAQAGAERLIGGKISAEAARKAVNQVAADMQSKDKE
jgi:F-type H+-transporting ATPase subunit b